MELLPVMAQIFETTVDKLLGVDDITESKKVGEYLSRFQQAISKGEIDECISIARNGVSEPTMWQGQSAATHIHNYLFEQKHRYCLGFSPISL